MICRYAFMLSVTGRQQLLEQVQGVLGTYSLELVLVTKLRCNLEDGTQCQSLGDGPSRISKMKQRGKTLGKSSNDVQCLGWSRDWLTRCTRQS